MTPEPDFLGMVSEPAVIAQLTTRAGLAASTPRTGLTQQLALDIAQDVAKRLHRDHPELRLRQASEDGLARELHELTRWLVAPQTVEPRFLRSGAVAICDRMLIGGFPRRSLIRALALIGDAMVAHGVMDPMASRPITDEVTIRLLERLVPDSAWDVDLPGPVPVGRRPIQNPDGGSAR
jgi:hypothetical protein